MTNFSPKSFATPITYRIGSNTTPQFLFRESRTCLIYLPIIALSNLLHAQFQLD